ncbi:MAG: flavin reductase family protein [Rhodothermales bacterium]
MQRRIEGEVLRKVMRCVPSPVTVVTVCGEKEIRGITIGSFASTSLRPPLISFNVNKDATIYDALVAANRFVVHILTEQQAHLSDHFAKPDLPADEQFEAIPYRLDPQGTPILFDTLAVISCERYAVHEAGDHSIIIGHVLDIEERPGCSPLIYYDRTYRRLGEEVEPTQFEPLEEGSRFSVLGSQAAEQRTESRERGTTN